MPFTYFLLISRHRKEFTMKVFELLCLTLIWYKCKAIDIDDIALPGCSSYDNCENSTNTQISTPSFSQSSSSVAEVFSEAEITDASFTTEYTKDDAKTISTLQTTTILSATTATPIATTTVNIIAQTASLLQKNHSNVCMCDTTVILSYVIYN